MCPELLGRHYARWARTWEQDCWICKLRKLSWSVLNDSAFGELWWWLHYLLPCAFHVRGKICEFRTLAFVTMLFMDLIQPLLGIDSQSESNVAMVPLKTELNILCVSQKASSRVLGLLCHIARRYLCPSVN